jgi:hypothetical protein
MKKNKGFLMGIAALALLFSMAFLGCESATGAQGEPGDGRGLDQNFTVSQDLKVVVPSKDYLISAKYAGIGIGPKDTIFWSVTGDDLESTSPGFKSGDTVIIPDPSGSSSGKLTVSSTEKSVKLTVTATYGGYTDFTVVEVGVRELTGLGLMPGREIGTTNVKEVDGGYIKPLLGPDNPDGTYLVYTRDTKQRLAVSRTEKIPFEGTVKINATPGTPDVDYDIPLPQEQWLTIYEVPLATGQPVEGHSTALGFISLPAADYDSANVKLPMMTAAGDGTLPRYPVLNQDGVGTSKFDFTPAGPNYLEGETSALHGKYPTPYTAYLVYYSKYDPITGEKLSNLEDYVPGLNTKFVPPSGNFQSITATTPPRTYLNKTGEWYYILQYTGAVTNTGTNAWNYVKIDGSGPGIAGPGTDTVITVLDRATFVKEIKKPDGFVNTVHISLSGDREFVDATTIQSLAGTLFPDYSSYAQVTRDSDTGVTLYLQNGDRTTLGTASGKPTFTIKEEAFKRGAAPQAISDSNFISVSASDARYADIQISGTTPAGITFTAGAQTQINVTSSATFPPLGSTENIYNGELTGIIQWNISWYYVNGSNWVSTGTANGSTFTPQEEDKGKTIGIRVDAEGNSPDVTLIEVTGNAPYTKWNMIGYGQRILGAVAR